MKKDFSSRISFIVQKSNGKFIAIFATLLLMAVPSAAFAVVAPQPPLIPSISLLILIFLTVNVAANIFSFLVGYMILGRAKRFAPQKFPRYLSSVIIGNTVISLLLFFLFLIYNNTDLNSSNFALFFSPYAFPFLAAYNYWVSKKKFNLNRTRAIVFGLLFGIFTNPGLLINLIGFVYIFSLQLLISLNIIHLVTPPSLPSIFAG
jgi:hypothetical protein